MNSRFAKLAALAFFAVGLTAVAPGDAKADVSSVVRSDVTVYGATWCSACKTLESGLRDRNVPFDVIDVDRNPQAFEKARSASGAGSAIPLTGIQKSDNTTWIVGADIDGVERAYKGN